MVDYIAKIKELEDEIRKTQYNKATQHHIGLLKAKIARLREQQLSRGSSGKKGKGYAVRKSGDATVVLFGYPSVGKSTLLNILTGANSEVGSYDFTTLDVIPGVLSYKHTAIQILDVPGIVKGASLGIGRGKEVLAVIRSANLVVFLVDVLHPEHYSVLKKEVYDTGIRVNEKKPDVKIKKKSRGGISIGTTVKLTKIHKKTIVSILNEFRISNADVVIRSDITAEQLIDVIEANKVYIPGITILTKIDLVDNSLLKERIKEIKPDLSISAENGINIEELKELIYKKLCFIRIYCKEIGKKADLEEPLILRKGACIKDMCEKLHKDFVSNFKFARVWGRSAKFPGQRLMLKHRLKDGDIVELHIR